MAESKVVLITGSSTGFGRRTAESLARRGHGVYATMRAVEGKNAEASRELRELAERESLSLKVVELDVTSRESIDAAVRTVVEDASRLDVVVNNAGLASLGPLEGYTEEQVRRMFETNVFGPVNVARAALPHLRRQRSGLIVNLSSVVGRVVFPGMGIYAASKFALEALSDTLRLEAGALGVDSVLVQPGAFETPIFDKLMQPGDADRVAGYEHLADLPEQFSAGVREFFRNEGAGDPQQVADAIVALVEADPGRRPGRIVVGADGKPVEALNAQAARTQREMLESFGMNAFVELVR